MDYHFISDGSFIFPGIENITESLGVNAFLYKIEDRKLKLNNIFSPQPGDLVCIIVTNARLRSRLLRKPVLARCRLIVMLDIPLTPSRLSHFPWLLPKNIGVRTFTEIIQKAQRTGIFRKKVSDRTQALFEELCNGKSAANISGDSLTSMKAVYRIKRNLFHEYGLLNCNSVGILICRDILSIKMPI